MPHDDPSASIRDVTVKWHEQRTVAGLYVVRCTKEGWEDRVRVGAGAIKGGLGGVHKRLVDHGRTWGQSPEWETHKLMPFGEVVRAWALDGWEGDRIADGEKALWLAFAVRFRKHRGTLRDASTFIVPVEASLEEVLARVDRDLGAFAAVHALANPVVEVPHEVTSVRRGVRRPRSGSAPAGPA